MSKFDYKITQQVYDWIINGNKNIEVRLLNEKSSSIKEKDIIIFSVINDDNKYIKVEVEGLYSYDTIGELLNDFDVENIADQTYTKDSLERLMIDIYGKDKVDSHKIIGIKFKKISDDKIIIDESIDKEPYIKELTNDNVINVTGETGSGKSFYSSK